MSFGGGLNRAVHWVSQQPRQGAVPLTRTRRFVRSRSRHSTTSTTMSRWGLRTFPEQSLRYGISLTQRTLSCTTHGVSVLPYNWRNADLRADRERWDHEGGFKNLVLLLRKVFHMKFTHAVPWGDWGNRGRWMKSPTPDDVLAMILEMIADAVAPPADSSTESRHEVSASILNLPTKTFVIQIQVPAEKLLPMWSVYTPQLKLLDDDLTSSKFPLLEKVVISFSVWKLTPEDVLVKKLDGWVRDHMPQCARRGMLETYYTGEHISRHNRMT